jgi:hypothetical protein
MYEAMFVDRNSKSREEIPLCTGGAAAALGLHLKDKQEDYQ